MSKEELSKRIGELYGLEAMKTYPLGEHGSIDIWLVEETGTMFELAVENDICFDPNNNGASTACIKLKGYIEHAIDAIHSDHPTKLEATLYAIGLALVKKKEMA